MFLTKTLVTPVRLLLLISYIGRIDSSWCAYDETLGWIRSRLPTDLRTQICDLREPQKTCNSKIYNDQEYVQLKRTIESIRESCGDLCDTSISSSRPSSECSTSGDLAEGEKPQFFECLRKNVNCHELWSNPLIDAPSEYCFPPRIIPKFLRSNFSYGGRVELQYYAYYNDLAEPHAVGRNLVSEII